MVCFIQERLSISGVTLEESEYSEGQQEKESDREDRQGSQGNQTGAFAGEPFFNQRSQQTNHFVYQKPGQQSGEQMQLEHQKQGKSSEDPGGHRGSRRGAET